MGLEMEVAARCASLNAGETDKLVVNKDSTNMHKKSYKTEWQFNCTQVLGEKEQVKRLSFVK